MTPHAIVQYVIYKWKAKSRHGIHSPFVYSLIDRCLLSHPSISLLQKLENYFGKERLFRFSDAPSAWQREFMQFEKELNSGGVLLIHLPHQTSNHTNVWDKLKDHSTVLLSIDLYEYGLLITPEGYKAKQHFLLKNGKA